MTYKQHYRISQKKQAKRGNQTEAIFDFPLEPVESLWKFYSLVLNWRISEGLGNLREKTNGYF